jgi:hypothetical protein
MAEMQAGKIKMNTAKLPKDYKGPLKGYYENTQKYF